MGGRTADEEVCFILSINECVVFIYFPSSRRKIDKNNVLVALVSVLVQKVTKRFL